MSVFFVATPLDAEKIAAKEFTNIWPHLLGKDLKPHGLPLPELKMLEGGFEFECDYFVGIQTNFFLKTANRVLLRMAEFKVRDLPKFYNKVLALPWGEYLHSQPTSFKISASESRLNNEKRLLESAEQAFQKILPNKVQGKELSAEIFIRVFQDTCTISLNLSGEHLHKRGWMILRGEAPLRETLAARMLLELDSLVTSEEVLFDPMMGSGTYLLEGRSLSTPNFLRDYDFLHFKKTAKIFLSPLFSQNYKNLPEGPYLKFLGIDRDAKMIEVVEKNFQHLESYLSNLQKKSFQKKDLTVFMGDSLQKMTGIPNDTILVCNPPYGERLEKATGGLTELVSNLTAYQPKVLAVLFPEKGGGLKTPPGYRLAKQVKINNGGIRCLYTILTQS